MITVHIQLHKLFQTPYSGWQRIYLIFHNTQDLQILQIFYGCKNKFVYFIFFFMVVFKELRGYDTLFFELHQLLIK